MGLDESTTQVVDMPFYQMAPVNNQFSKKFDDSWLAILVKLASTHGNHNVCLIVRRSIYGAKIPMC